MIVFNNISGILALSIMLASTLGAAAPTPNSEKAAATALLGGPWDFLLNLSGTKEPVSPFGFKREDTDSPIAITI